MVDTVDSSTVLVTECVKRTQKLLMAVGQAKPICSPDWIRKSKKAGEFLGNAHNRGIIVVIKSRFCRPVGSYFN